MVAESQRLASVVPNGVVRLATADTTVEGGFTVSRGRSVMANLSYIHRDPAVWKGPDPEVFAPERFLDFEGTVIGSNQCLF